MKPHLLVVEADEQVRRWLGMHIDSLWPDARVDYCRLEDAWATLKANAGSTPVDLLPIGLGPSLPERDLVWRLLARLKTWTASPPALVIASGGDARAAVAAMRKGASDYLPRESLGPPDLHRALQDALRRAEARRARNTAGANPGGRRTSAASRDAVPRYRLLRTLGGSHAATVWLAHSEQLGIDVALKVGKAGVEDPESRRQLAEERAAIAALKHPAVVTLHDYGVHDGREFLAMEYFPCGDLRQRLNNPQTPARAVRYAREIALALQAVHDAGFMHRDLKPHNVMLRADGSVVLIDFGLARALASQTHLTAAGVLRGSPYYMSPEQVNGLTLDVRSDIYSLGVMFYEMLCGQRPYIGNSALELMEQHVEGQRPPLPEELAGFESAIASLMAVDRTQRCHTAAEAVSLFDELASGRLHDDADITCTQEIAHVG